MLYLSDNLRLLRRQQNISQQALAERLHISRASLAKYEGAVNEPSLDVLVRISRYFQISIDVLLTLNIGQSEVNLDKLRYSSEQSMILPIQVNQEGENVIEIVPHHAQAGYMGNYNDPGFIESLDQMALPFQALHGKCRAFPIDGDSMPPFGPGSFVVGRQILDLHSVKRGFRYVLVSRDQGIVFKRVYPDPNSRATWKLVSDNPKHEPFEIHLNEIVEVWEFVAGISFEGAGENSYAQDVIGRVQELQEQLSALASELSVNP